MADLRVCQRLKEISHIYITCANLFAYFKKQIPSAKMPA